jgi:hypothetical protein
LSFVEILAHVIVQFQNRTEAITFLQQIEPKVKISNEAVALCKVLAGQILLNDLQDQDATKVMSFTQTISPQTNTLIKNTTVKPCSIVQTGDPKFGLYFRLSSLYLTLLVLYINCISRHCGI